MCSDASSRTLQTWRFTELKAQEIPKVDIWASHWKGDTGHERLERFSRSQTALALSNSTDQISLDKDACTVQVEYVFFSNSNMTETVSQLDIVQDCPRMRASNVTLHNKSSLPLYGLCLYYVPAQKEVDSLSERTMMH